MAWRQLTNQQVLEEFTPQEKAALNAIHGATDQLPRILERTVLMARGKILAGGGLLADGLTAPDQAATDVIDIARWRWLVSFPALKALQTKERKDANDEAVKRLEDIAVGKTKVENPDGTTPITRPSFCEPNRNFTGRDEDGI